MSVLRLDRVRREIGTFVILDSISAALAAGDRVGLVGANGAGKTTLLTIAAGFEEPDVGAVHRKRGLEIGYLPQEANLDEAFVRAPTLRAAVRAGATAIEALERELHTVEAAGSDAVASARYAELRERFDALEGYRLDQRVEETLSGLGFSAADLTRSPAELSGGEQTRAALARLLIADPELMLLDEPTNHLDIAALEWLEIALTRRRGTLLIASHDRAFLDAVVTRIWEIRERKLEAFRGNFASYAVQREARDARLRKDAETQRAAAEREAELIQVYRSHRKYSKMHEHEKRLERLTVTEAPRGASKLALRARGASGEGPVRSGDLVLSMNDAVAGFGADNGSAPAAIVRVARVEARRGDRIGIVGPNGAGKTTLLRTIAGELPLLGGELRVGANVQLGYLAQLRRMAFPGQTVLDAMLAASGLDEGPARTYLGRFLFRGDDAFKQVARLSGGERSRLELALLGIRPANVLLLDEPTNHLDIPAREALESFLRKSTATLFVVSHDRRLLEVVCEKLWVVEPRVHGEPARIAPFDGTYREWRVAVGEGWTAGMELERRTRGAVETAVKDRHDSVRQEIRPARAGRSPTRLAALSKDVYRRQKAVIEADLTRLGLRKSHLELALGDAGVQSNFVELRRLSSELADVDAALSQAEDAWLALEERAPR